jgi:hypothetical protein
MLAMMRRMSRMCCVTDCPGLSQVPSGMSVANLRAGMPRAPVAGSMREPANRHDAEPHRAGRE